MLTHKFGCLFLRLVTYILWIDPVWKQYILWLWLDHKILTDMVRIVSLNLQKDHVLHCGIPVATEYPGTSSKIDVRFMPYLTEFSRLWLPVKDWHRASWFCEVRNSKTISSKWVWESSFGAIHERQISTTVKVTQVEGVAKCSCRLYLWLLVPEKQFIWTLPKMISIGS